MAHPPYKAADSGCPQQVRMRHSQISPTTNTQVPVETQRLASPSTPSSNHSASTSESPYSPMAHALQPAAMNVALTPPNTPAGASEMHENAGQPDALDQKPLHTMMMIMYIIDVRQSAEVPPRWDGRNLGRSLPLSCCTHYRDLIQCPVVDLLNCLERGLAACAGLPA